MAGKSPKFYKDKWYNHYKKIADSRGIKFTKRHWRRIESGFAFEEWLVENNKLDGGLTTLFQWYYTDAVESLMLSPSKLVASIPLDRFQGTVLYQPVSFGIPIGYKRKGSKSHADLWKIKLD